MLKRTAFWLGFVLALSVLLPGCAEAARPSFSEWEPRWDALTASIPTESELMDPPNGETCDQALGAVRTASVDMTLTPDQATDGVVREWIEVAEMTFFECPPEGNEIDSMAKAYDALERLEAEVEAVIELDHDRD